MLQINNLSKSFSIDGINKTKVLNNIKLNIKDSDFITIVGSNGAGKTTLFNCLSGKNTIDEGEIILDNQNISKQKEYERSKYIGRLFQDPLKGTAPNMSVEENLALAYLRANNSKNPLSTLSNKDRQLIKERLKELNLGLEDKLNQKVALLSGGQRQALTLLMATIVSPKILLLDEHTAALDPNTSELIMDLTNKIVSRNYMTCLMITHNLNQAINTGNRLLMMESGNIVLDIQGKEKEKLTVNKLLTKFKQATGNEFNNDKILLSKQ